MPRYHRGHLAGYVLGGVAREAYRRFRPYIRRFAFGPGAVAAAAAANYFAKVPKLDTSPPMPRPFPEGPSRAAKRRKSGAVVQDASGYIQLTNLGKRNIGRKCSKYKKLRKMVEAQMLTRIDRFQNLAGTGAQYGTYNLSFWKDVAVATQYRYPFYLFDLTCLNENTGVTKAGGAVTTLQAAPFMRLYREVAGNAPYKWQITAGLSNAATSTNLWTSERVPYSTSSNANLPYEKAFLEWADIRLSFWGAKALPSSAEVMLVRFPNDNRHPSAWQYDGVTNNDLSETNNPADPKDPAFQEYQKFWSCQVDNLTLSNHHLHGQAADQDGMQVLYRKKINFNPTATYETDTAGHQYTMKLFYNMDMLCSYKSSPQSQVGDGVAPVDFENVNKWYPEVPEQYSCSAHLRNKGSRVFLLIRGFASTLQTTTDTADNAASFDMQIRRKMSVI